MEDYKFTRDTYMDAYNTDIARRATAGGVLRQFNETATRNMAHFGPSYDELLDSGRYFSAAEIRGIREKYSVTVEKLKTMK